MFRGKKYQESAKLIDRSVQYDPAEALDLVVKGASAKFDETVELHIKLGVDSRHADQQVRGAVVLPNGTGKTARVLVFAKDEQTKRALQDNWEEAVQERKYIAVLEGQINGEEGYIETWMYENPRSLMVHCYDIRPGDTQQKPPRKDWKYASSHCRKVKDLTIEGKPYTEVEFNLETGRRNQIRVHSQYIGHPIAGDKKYGAQTNPLGRLALHAQTLAFIHPWTGKTMKFTARLPKSFSRLK